MRRSSQEDLANFDPERDKTFHKLVRSSSIRSIVVSESLSYFIGIAVDSVESEFEPENNSFEFVGTTRMDNQNQNKAEYRTIKELVAPDVHYQPICIDYLELDANFKLKYGLIHLLPKFHGLAGKGPAQASKRVPCGLFYYETTRSTRGAYKIESIPFLLGWCCKRLAILFPSCYHYKMRRIEEDVIGEVLPHIKNCCYKEGDMWN